MQALTQYPRRRLLFVMSFLSIVTNSPRGFCSEAPIITGSQIMAGAAQQELWIQNYMSNQTYTWELVAGDADLQGNTGEKITIVAPSSNSNCQNNPTIRVTCSDGSVSEYSIAVNAYHGSEKAFRETSNVKMGAWDQKDCKASAEGDSGACVYSRDYTCDDTYIPDPNTSNRYTCYSCPSGLYGGASPLGLCTFNFCPGAVSFDACYNDCILDTLSVLSAAPPGGLYDLRSPTIKTQGCCPLVSLPGYQKPEEVPLDRRLDLGVEPSSIASPEVPSTKCITYRGNPVNIQTGNNYETEEDVRLPSPNRLQFTLKRSYNSRSVDSSTMGNRWTHTYNVILNPSYPFGYQFKPATLVNITDETGRSAYFKESSSGYFEGVFNEPTRVTVEGGNYVWYRVNGSRYVFDPSGKLIWLEDEVGNRQLLVYDGNGRLQTVTDEASSRILTFHYSAGLLEHITGPVTSSVPDGIWVRYGYDANQNLVSVTYADGSGFDYIYGDPTDAHNLTEKHDKLGHLISTWTYDFYDRVTESFTRGGGDLSIIYGSKTEVTDGYGVTRTYKRSTVNSRRVIMHIDNPEDCPGCGEDVVRLSYDSSARIIEARYANGMIKQFDDFDGRDNPQTVILAVGTAEGKTVHYTYHPDMDARLSETEPSVLGTGTMSRIWDYDNDGNATPNENPTRLLYRRIEKGYTKDLSGNVIPYEYLTTFTYDNKGEILTIDGPKPGTVDLTTFAYDETTGNLLAVTYPVVGTMTYSDYNAAGQVGRVTDANGNAIIYTYDGYGQVVTVTNQAEGSVTSYDYNTAGVLEQVTRPNGVTTDFIYDVTYGRLATVLDPMGNTIHYDYDSQGNRVEVSHFDAGSQRRFWKRFDYQGISHPGKLWKQINPDDTYTEYTYDSGGNIETITDAAGKTTTYGYDSFKRLTVVKQPGGTVTSYDYDDRGNLISVTDAENHQTTYVYDDLGRLVETASPDTGTTRYAYDAAGNLTAKTDASGIAVTYDYDDLDRLTAVHFPDTSQDISHSYDQGTNGKGRLTGMHDPSGGYTYTYDAVGNLVSEEKVIDGATYVTQYAYDAAGTLSGMTYPDGRTVTYELDASGRVSRVTSTKESVTITVADNIDYLPFGPLSAMTYGSGTAVTKTFDQLYRLKELEAGKVLNPVQSTAYVLDAVGNITGITNNLDAARNQAFRYDDLYRLTSATGIYGVIGYTYDKVGNRLNKTEDGATDTYGYQFGTNRLSNITGGNLETFTLDDSGNTTGMEEKILTYNQNHRLIQVAENTITLGAYVYNGNGQRIKKTADGETTIFHYDVFGNLIGESTPTGAFISQYVYLDNRRLAAISEDAAQEITVHVETSTGMYLSGIPVYAFTDGGAYTGESATTDEDGVAHFEIGDFPDHNYRFRADYMSYQFWTDVMTMPGTFSAMVEIEEEPATVQVIQGGSAKPGVTVYLFNATGRYLGMFATTDENGSVIFNLPAGKDFTFRADNMASQYWSDAVTIVSGGVNHVGIDSGGGILTVTVDKSEGTPISDIKTYLFKGDGTAYLGLWQTTDALGEVAFAVPSGSYIIRADYMGYQFWSTALSVTADDALLVSIPHQDVTITFQGDHDGSIEQRDGTNVYLFTEVGAYQGMYHMTDAQGKAVFNVPEKSYKVRADYMSQQHWSEAFVWTDKTVTIEEGTALVTMTHMGLPVDGGKVYVFAGSGTYLGLYDVTDQNGQVAFRLPAGAYNFRADFQGSQFWSGVTTVIAHVENPVTISAGGGAFTLTVLKDVADLLEGARCYLFTDTGSYLATHGVTSSEGKVVFNLAAGDYKIRVDHLGYQFWTDVFTVPDTLFMERTIDHQDVTFTVQHAYRGDSDALTGAKVYLFTPAGSFLGHFQKTDGQGQAVFNLPERDYKIRVDYLAKQYWSAVINWEDDTVTINDGLAEVNVTTGVAPLENVPVYVFSDLGAYLGIRAETDQNGIATFRLPEGTYKFRADHLSNHYWASELVTAHEVEMVHVDTGGGTFTFTAEKGAGIPLVDVPVYVFTSGGTYLGLNAHTDANGHANFELPDGAYTFRVDYLGHQFWSGVSTAPTTLSDVLTIPHQDVTISVERLCQEPSEALESVPVYLFAGGGAYLGQSLTTNAQGEVVFNLPEKSYKVRADYLGSQFWSEPLISTHATVTLDHGLAVVHVAQGGGELTGAPVYLFTPAGSYLKRSEHTDGNGLAQFLLPNQQYKFRVDYGGSQYWSHIVTIIPFEENHVELNLDLLALDLTNGPDPVRYQGVAPEPEKNSSVLALLSTLPGLWVDNAHAQGGSEVMYFFINDHLGAPQAVVDEIGEVVWSADYLPFGGVNETVDPVVNNFRLPGQYFDGETGLHYNYYRYYDPRTGRYLTPDPIGLAGGVNLYVYVENSPKKATDPRGLWSSKIHNRIILSAYPYLPNNLRQAIERGSEYADSSQFQSPGYSYMHAMRGTGQSAEEACNRIIDYVDAYTEMYKELLTSGRQAAAYFALGMALHPIMDSTSPPHAGFQEWKGAWRTSGYEFFTHWAAEREINGLQIQQNVNLINRVLK